MADDKKEIGNVSAERLCLESILNQKVSIDTDIADFLLIAGWESFGGPIYQRLSDELRQELKEYVNGRRERLLSSEKHKESRFRNSIVEGGYGKKFKTLGELKGIIENEGIKIRNLHYKTLAYFNDALREYGVKPIKVGGRYTPGILRDLKKYGLAPAKKKNLYNGPE